MTNVPARRRQHAVRRGAPAPTAPRARAQRRGVCERGRKGRHGGAARGRAQGCARTVVPRGELPVERQLSGAEVELRPSKQCGGRADRARLDTRRHISAGRICMQASAQADAQCSPASCTGRTRRGRPRRCNRIRQARARPWPRPRSAAGAGAGPRLQAPARHQRQQCRRRRAAARRVRYLRAQSARGCSPSCACSCSPPSFEARETDRPWVKGGQILTIRFSGYFESRFWIFSVSVPVPR